MENEQKTKEIAINNCVDYFENDIGWNKQSSECECYESAIEMAIWKDKQFAKEKTCKWHKISDGDFPKFTGDYLLVCKNKNKEDGIFLYEIAYYTGDEWDNRTNYEDIIAWREIPKYNEE